MAAAIAIAITAAACSGRTSSSGADSTGLKGARFTLMLQSTANANKVVEVHAVNALKAQGVNASIKWNASSPNIAITQLTTGTIDAYSEAVLGGVGAVASGIKMKDFALAQPRQDYVLLASSGINTLADLKGKKIGIQDTTGVNYAQALMVVQKAGLTPKDVDIIAVGVRALGYPRWWPDGWTRRCSATRPSSSWVRRASRQSSITPRTHRTSTTTTSSPARNGWARTPPSRWHSTRRSSTHSSGSTIQPTRMP